MNTLNNAISSESMCSVELLTEYVRLLRCAWLNPSDVCAQDGVREFEREHAEELLPLWKQWQEDKPKRYPEKPPNKMCCYSLPPGIHAFNCRAWRP